jgi:T5SS/PEP-CTERM-associated repeat protein
MGGNANTGALNVLSGGTATGGSFAVLGTNAGALGRIAVDGAGSSWTNTGILEVGRDGIF